MGHEAAGNDSIDDEIVGVLCTTLASQPRLARDVQELFGSTPDGGAHVVALSWVSLLVERARAGEVGLDDAAMVVGCARLMDPLRWPEVAEWLDEHTSR